MNPYQYYIDKVKKLIADYPTPCAPIVDRAWKIEAELADQYYMVRNETQKALLNDALDYLVDVIAEYENPTELIPGGSFMTAEPQAPEDDYFVPVETDVFKEF